MLHFMVNLIPNMARGACRMNEAKLVKILALSSYGSLRVTLLLYVNGDIDN